MLKRAERGSVLVLAIFFMVILFITASAFLVLLPMENRAAMRSERQTSGALVADAGVTEAMAWLRNQLAPPDGSASREPMNPSVYPSQANRTRDVGGGWTYRWELVADPETYPNGSNPIRAYTIVSKSYLRGKAMREARAEVIQESLSQYAALYNTWSTNLVMPVRSTSVPTGGPVHVNDTLRLWISEGANYWTSTGDPKFSHGLTASGTFTDSDDGFAYYQGNWYGSSADKRPYDDNGPIASRYNRMADGGRDSLIAGASNVELPENTFEIRDAAWGFEASNPLPTTAGVYLNEEAGQVQGIYIHGDAEEIELGYGGSQPAGPGTVNYANNSWVKVELPIAGQRSIDDDENVTVVTIDENPITLPAGAVVDGAPLGSPTTYPVDTTLVRRANGTFEHYDSKLNGVVYAKGDIKDLWGVNKGRRTISVEGDASANVQHTIYFGGKEDDTTGVYSVAAGEKGLIQYGSVDADNDGVLDAPTTADNVLGIVARDVLVSDKLKHNGQWDTSHPETNPLYLYAIVLGGLNGDGGSYKVESYNSGNDGWTYRYGSRIIVDAGAWGTTSGHGLVNGNTFYDAPAAQQPPPYFPGKPSFVVKSYEDIPVIDGETL